MNAVPLFHKLYALAIVLMCSVGVANAQFGGFGIPKTKDIKKAVEKEVKEEVKEAKKEVKEEVKEATSSESSEPQEESRSGGRSGGSRSGGGDRGSARGGSGSSNGNAPEKVEMRNALGKFFKIFNGKLLSGDARTMLGDAPKIEAATANLSR